MGIVEYYHTDGGSQNPYFRYRIPVKNVINEMFLWCDEYKHYSRYHCIWKDVSGGVSNFIQFEHEEPAIMFALKFGAL